MAAAIEYGLDGLIKVNVLYELANPLIYISYLLVMCPFYERFY